MHDLLTDHFMNSESKLDDRFSSAKFGEVIYASFPDWLFYSKCKLDDSLPSAKFWQSNLSNSS